MRSFDCMPAVRTPEAPRDTRHLTHPGILPSPLGEKVGCFNQWISGLFLRSLSFRPAGLPVYASQWPLPDTTQDSVHSCWLGFTMVAISGDWIPCACKAQLPHHRTYRSVYGGSREARESSMLFKKAKQTEMA